MPTLYSPKMPRSLPTVFQSLKKCLLLSALLGVGCVQREMTVLSNPTGAVIYLNDREIGRTPFKRKFLWYGTYDVVARKDGCKTLKTAANIFPPIWQLVPLDAVTDFLPLRDEHTVHLDLQANDPVDPPAIVARGQAMQQELQSSIHTINRSALDVHPTTKPTTQPDIQDAS